MTFFHDATIAFSREKLSKHYLLKLLELVDNVLFLIYMVSTYSYCYISSSFLNLMDSVEIPKDKGYVCIKKMLLVLMGLQIFLYFTCLLTVSFYVPAIEVEKNLFILIISTIGVNSIIFVFCTVFFIWTLKYDLYYINLNLTIMPDIEYFVDFDDDKKLTDL